MLRNIKIRATTPEGQELEIACLLAPPAAAELSHRLKLELGDELIAVDVIREPVELCLAA